MIKTPFNDHYLDYHSENVPITNCLILPLPLPPCPLVFLQLSIPVALLPSLCTEFGKLYTMLHKIISWSVEDS